MAQAFRQIPRRMASRPGQLRSVTASFQESLQIQQCAKLAARLQQQLRQMQQRIQPMPVNAERQRLQQNIHKLKTQLKGHHEDLHQWRSEARAVSLSAHTRTPHDEEKAASIYFHKLYTEHHPLPRALREKYVLATPQQGDFKAFHQALAPLYQELIFKEQKSWQGFWGVWDPIEELQQEPEPFALLSFDVPENVPAPEVSEDPVKTIPRTNTLTAPLVTVPKDEPLQVSFDFAKGKSTVRNTMGITLNQPKKTYAEYLQLGFTDMDEAVASSFEKRHLLENAVSHFLEAMSLDKSRHEAYFGLGYLYALVQDTNHAMYFLDVAYKISKDPAIHQLMERVKGQLKL